MLKGISVIIHVIIVIVGIGEEIIPPAENVH
jgi:hypothetical protein